jgi:hypothetical protein
VRHRKLDATYSTDPGSTPVLNYAPTSCLTPQGDSRCMSWYVLPCPPESKDTYDTDGPRPPIAATSAGSSLGDSLVS